MNKFNKHDYVKSDVTPNIEGYIITAKAMPTSIKIKTKPLVGGIILGYNIRLANGNTVWAPEDDLVLITAATNIF